MAPGRKTGGKVKGSKNKATLEREEAARIERERVAELERMAAQGATELDKAKLHRRRPDRSYSLSRLRGAGGAAWRNQTDARVGRLRSAR